MKHLLGPDAVLSALWHLRSSEAGPSREERAEETQGGEGARTGQPTDRSASRPRGGSTGEERVFQAEGLTG